jgi:Tol biopolymer transport system component
MAPEQLEGRDADPRTDVFAFGAVLYEMATGQRAFTGTSQASLIASILKEQPRAMTELAPMTPPALDHVVKRCLEKNPDDRWQSSRDIGLELAWIRDAGSGAGLPAPVAAHRRIAARTAWITAAICAAAAIGLGTLLLTHRPPPLEVVRFTITAPGNQAIRVGQPYLAIAPDGNQVAFCASDTLGVPSVWVRRLDTLESKRISGTERANMLFWSHDSRHIGFFADGKLRRVSIDGGVVQTLCDAPDARGGTWGINDDIVFQPTASGALFRIAARGGEASAVTVVDTASGEQAHRFPNFLPDGKHFLFVVLPEREGMFDVRVGSLDGETTPVIARAGGAAVYARPGFLLYNRDGHLVAQPFDANSRMSNGEPVPVGELSGATGDFSGSPGASVSDNGVLARSFADFPNTSVQWLERGGQPRGRLALPDGYFMAPVFSRDGRRLCIEEWRQERSANLWLVEIERNVATRFTFNDAENFGAMWSPDGKSIVFTSNREGRENLYIKPSDGSRDEERLFDSGALFTKTEDWVPDGSAIVYSVLTEKSGSDLWLYPIVGERKPRLLLRSRFNEGNAVISPDGRLIAYRCDDSGRSEIYVQSFPDMGPKHRASDDAHGVFSAFQTFAIAWSGSGGDLVYMAADGITLLSVGVSGQSAALDIGPPRPAWRLPLGSISYGIHPDGQRVLVSGPDLGGTPLGVTVVMNWPRLLARE